MYDLPFDVTAELRTIAGLRTGAMEMHTQV